MSGGVLVLVAVTALAFVIGCGGESETTDATTAPPADERSAPKPEEKPAAETVAPSHCEAGRPSCRVAEGRIVYVERVDPDADGDAHFVIADPQGITLPGLTAIDVRKGLRPHPLPGPGDLISAAGPVQIGSYGQSQIHSLELHVAGE
jgi:pyruvate/2-oxoglutarate dehydrogenase complex dihydrolipoamide acyltransferase (E2) component